MSMLPPKFPKQAIALLAFFAISTALQILVVCIGAPLDEFLGSIVGGISIGCFTWAMFWYQYKKDMRAFRREFEQYYGYSYYQYLQMKRRDKINANINAKINAKANDIPSVNTPRFVVHREGPLTFDDIVARGEAGEKVYVPAFQQWCEVDPDSDSVYGNECYCDIAHAVLIGTYDHE